MKDDYKILVSRTDNIGDVILSFPMLGIIKEHYPNCTLFFLGSNYTRPIATRCRHIDHFIAEEDLTIDKLMEMELDVFIHVFPKKHLAILAKKAGVPIRIGTSHRIYHWSTCNKLISFTRVNSYSHEAVLNLNLLSPLSIKNNYTLENLHCYTGWVSKNDHHDIISNDKTNVLFHMKSNGSAVEWSVKNYLLLANLLPSDKFTIYLTGTDDEKDIIESECPEIFVLSHVKDMLGKFTLDEFIDFVEAADGLVACSTGSLHIASTSGIHTLGLYPKKRPMHSGRWSPIGPNSVVLDADINITENKIQLDLNYQKVLSVIKEWKSI